MDMEGEQRKSGWKIWLYLTPVYIILAVPLYKWTVRVNSGDVKLSKDEYGAFNAEEGEIKKPASGNYDPGLNDQGYSIRYRTGHDAQEEGSLDSGEGSAGKTSGTAGAAADSGHDGRQAQRPQGQPGQYRAQSANQAALTSDSTKAKESMAFGYQKGLMTQAIGKVMGSPKAVGAILNNKYVVEGFMARGTVKAATSSPQGLANYLKGSGPANFLGNPVVQAALNNPAIVSAVANSGIVSAMLSSPAAQALMKDPQALGDLVSSNPQLMSLAMQNPQLLTSLMANPDVSSKVNKFDTSKIPKY